MSISTPATVLIIEDASYLAESLIDMLHMAGYTTMHAPTGEQGVGAAITHQPDLTILDIRLPDINGYEVYRRIRETSWGKTARIVILTASESIEHIAANIDIPREDIMFKPHWSLQKLQEKVAERVISK